VRKIVKAFKMF